MILVRDIAGFLVLEDEPVEAALRRISANKSRAVFVVAPDGRLVGSLTDGDFRRWLVGTDSPSLAVPCGEVAHRDCTWVRAGDASAKVDLLFTDAITLIPVLDDRRRVVAVARPRVKELVIDGRRIAAGEPSFVIAEIGINHNGSVDAGASELVDLAADRRRRLREVPAARHGRALPRRGAGERGRGPRRRSTPSTCCSTLQPADRASCFEVFDHCRDVGIDTAVHAVGRAERATSSSSYGIPAFKIASADLTNHALLDARRGDHGTPADRLHRHVDRGRDPRDASPCCGPAARPYALLHCQSTYPAPFKDVNLRYLDRLAEIGDCPVGYSGHERGFHVARGRGRPRCHDHREALHRRPRHGGQRPQGLACCPTSSPRWSGASARSRRPWASAGARAVSTGEMMNRRQPRQEPGRRPRHRAGRRRSTDADRRRQEPRAAGCSPTPLDRLVGRTADPAPVPAGDFFYATDLSDAVSKGRATTRLPPAVGPARALPRLSRPSPPSRTPDFLEFHFSYKDLEIDLATMLVPSGCRWATRATAPTCSPATSSSNLAAEDDAHWERSIAELQRVIDLTRALRPVLHRRRRRRRHLSVGGFTSDRHAAARRAARHVRAGRGRSRPGRRRRGCGCSRQTLPPFPWYLGGQLYCNLFVDPFDTAQFSPRLPASGSASTSRTPSSPTTSSAVRSPRRSSCWHRTSDHLHLVDAAGRRRRGRAGRRRRDRLAGAGPTSSTGWPRASASSRRSGRATSTRARASGWHWSGSNACVSTPRSHTGR